MVLKTLHGRLTMSPPIMIYLWHPITLYESNDPIFALLALDHWYCNSWYEQPKLIFQITLLDGALIPYTTSKRVFAG